MYPWEAALLLSLCAVLLSGLWAQGRQRALSDKVVRLHVIAASDSETDQAVKLQVRDAVLQQVTPLLEGAADRSEAVALLQQALGSLEEIAGEISGTEATATLGRENYPTREYDSFSLPAGEYTSLRIVLGEGKGRNWWCVVYPPLCLSGPEEVQETAALSEDDVKLITEDGEGYVFRFRLMEWWGDFARRWE